MYHGVVRTWQGADWLVATLRLETKKKQNVSPVWSSRWVTVKNPRRLITIVITDFYQKLDASGKESINKLAMVPVVLVDELGPICIGAICGSHDAKESDLRISV